MLRRVLYPGQHSPLRLRSGAVVRYADGLPLDPVTEADTAWMLSNWGPAVSDGGPWGPPPVDSGARAADRPPASPPVVAEVTLSPDDVAEVMGPVADELADAAEEHRAVAAALDATASAVAPKRRKKPRAPKAAHAAAEPAPSAPAAPEEPSL